VPDAWGAQKKEKDKDKKVKKKSRKLFGRKGMFVPRTTGKNLKTLQTQETVVVQTS